MAGKHRQQKTSWAHMLQVWLEFDERQLSFGSPWGPAIGGHFPDLGGVPAQSKKDHGRDGAFVEGHGLHNRQGEG